MARATRLIAVAAVVLAGCSSLLGSENDPGVQQLRASRKQWQDLGISDYKFVVINSCFCDLAGDSVEVTVADGTITSRVLLETGEPVPAAYISDYRTIDGLFALLVNAHDRDTIFLEVQYDNTWGYPLHVYIDYSNSAFADEFGWDIVRFNPGG